MSRVTITHLVFVTADLPEPLEVKAVELVRKRLARRTALPIESTTVAEYAPQPDRYPIFLGVGPGAPSAPEAYRLEVTVQRAVIESADPRGVLYGAGRLLHAATCTPEAIALPLLHELQAPATADRGVYFATHFNNYYECAPLEDVLDYIEELALWGCNLLTCWFDMNWYPYGFWEDDDSAGMRMVRRLRAVLAAARACGMQAGACGVANEGFSFHAPPELRADIRAQRGGFYPDSQICPSQPGGLELILANRRRVLELLGPLDVFYYWPYDQGGCGCDQCSDDKHRWGKTFLEIGPAVAQVVRELNPDARFLVSTWFMDDLERELVYAACARGADWFDGLILQTEHANERTLPTRYTRWVFPEISMFDCYFTSYGCNGANPAPVRFVAEARAVVTAGCGEMMYSEGIYEDLNKLTWLCTLWHPATTPQDVADAYARYYLGDPAAAALLLQLESTWGATKLRNTSLETVQGLFDAIAALEPGLPPGAECRLRWQQLRDRAEIDLGMARVGPDAPLIPQARRLLELACFTADLPALRVQAAALLAQLEARQAGIDQLFETYWRYLTDFHLDRVTLIFTPDEYLGKHDWAPLAAVLRDALAAHDNAACRDILLKGFRRWFWFNGLGVDFLFL